MRVRVNERRNNSRNAAPNLGLVSVYVRSSLNGQRKDLGSSIMRDISGGGIAIQMDKPIAVGQKVYLENHYVRHVAQVRHCLALEAGFRVGLRILPV